MHAWGAGMLEGRGGRGADMGLRRSVRRLSQAQLPWANPKLTLMARSPADRGITRKGIAKNMEVPRVVWEELQYKGWCGRSSSRVWKELQYKGWCGRSSSTRGGVGGAPVGCGRSSSRVWEELQ